MDVGGRGTQIPSMEIMFVSRATASAASQPVTCSEFVVFREERRVDRERGKPVLRVSTGHEL